MKFFLMNHRGTEAQSTLELGFPSSSCARTLLTLAILCASVPLWFNSAWAQPAHEHESKGNAATNYLWEKSDEAFHGGDYVRAIQCHKGIVAIDPHDVESFAVAAWLMWSIGKKDEALSHIERGLRANDTDWEMWDEAAQHYQLQAGRDEASPLLLKAKDAYARAVQLLPADADRNDAQMLRRRFAHAADKAGDLELALATWKKLVEDYPDEVVNKNNMARVEQKIADKASEKKRAAMTYGAGGVAFLAMIGVGAVIRKRAAI